jgi:CheY-like chemotaxis protein
VSGPDEKSNVPSLKGLHVLVIDDDEVARYAWRSYLTRASAIVSVAADGPSALQVLQKNPVDIVIADLALPGMSGMEVVTHWSLARLLAPPVIAIAVTAHPELRAEALRAGFTAVLEKAVDPLELVQEIARTRNGRRGRRG